MIGEDTKKKDRIMATFWSALESATCRYKGKNVGTVFTFPILLSCV